MGIHNEENSLFLGLNSGIEGNFRWKTGILPVYLNGKIALEVFDYGKLILAYGYGKSFQIGPENMKGYLRKYTIAYAMETTNDNINSFFVEINNHGFNFPNGGPSAVTLNIGFTYTFL